MIYSKHFNKLISEAFLSINYDNYDYEYEITDAQADHINIWVKDNQLTEYDPSFLLYNLLKDNEIKYKGLMDILWKIPNVEFGKSSKNRFQDLQQFISHLLWINRDKIDQIEDILDKIDNRRIPNKKIEIPDILTNIADVHIESPHHIGKGELVILFLFKNSEIFTGLGQYDVSINNKFWHVKNQDPHVGIRMGAADAKLFNNSKAYLIMRDKDINVSGSKVTRAELDDALKEVASKTRKGRKQFEDNIVDTALGQAVGIIWYYDNILYFSKRINLEPVSVTQGGRIVLRDKRF